jgi:endoglycosylceramidase
VIARRLLALALSAAALLPALTVRAAPPAIGQAGRWFVDATGRVRVMHGVAFTTKEFSTQHFSTEFGADDAAFLASNGLDIFRLAVFPSGVIPAPGTFDTAYVDGIERIVDIAAAAGIHVVIDFHQDLYANKYYGRGLPDWMGENGGLPNMPSTGFPGNYFTNVGMWRAYDTFWLNGRSSVDGVPLQEHYARAWRFVATRFAHHPGVLGFEIMNEPFPGTQWPTCASPLGCPVFDSLLTGFSRRLARAISSVAPGKFVFYEPNVTFDFGANTWHGDVGVRPAAFSFHVYCLGLQFGTPPVGSELCGPLGERPQFGYAADHSARFRVPLLLSEFGHFTAPPDEDTSPVIRRVAGFADEVMASWTYWDYARPNPQDGVTNYGSEQMIRDLREPPEGDNLIVPRVDAVVRAYPRAIAGTPRRWAWDQDTRVFTLEYVPARADGAGAFGTGSVTEIVVPARHFPAGYTVRVRGASVVSAPGDPILRLALSPGARSVSVTVKPA